MIHITLSDTAVAALERQFLEAKHVRLRERIQMVLMAQRGRPREQIAADTGHSTRNVQRWLNVYLERGLDGLKPRPRPGAKPKLLPEHAALLREWVLKGPTACGLDRANWTYEELAQHLFVTQGLSVKKSAVAEFCAKHDIRPYRPTYRYLRGDPKKQAQARQDLAALKKSHGRGDRTAQSG